MHKTVLNKFQYGYYLVAYMSLTIEVGTVRHASPDHIILHWSNIRLHPKGHVLRAKC